MLRTRILSALERPISLRIDAADSQEDMDLTGPVKAISQFLASTVGDVGKFSNRPPHAFGLLLDSQRPSLESVACLLASLSTPGSVLTFLPPSETREKALTLCHESGVQTLLLTTATSTSLGLTSSSALPGTHLVSFVVPPSPSSPSISLPLDTALIVRTSGSSSSHPSLVPLTSTAIWNRIRWMQSAFPDLYRGPALIKTSPLFVDSIAEILGPLLSSPCPRLVICSSLPSDSLLPLILREGITHLVAVPTLWRLLLDQDTGGLLRTSSLRYAISSGEALTGSLCRRLRAALHPEATILNIWGASETTADATCFVVPDAWREDEGNVPTGLPLPGFRIQIVQLEGGRLVPAPFGATGHIVVSGEGVSPGYLLAPPPPSTVTELIDSVPCYASLSTSADASLALSNDTNPSATRVWFSGDMGHVDATGCLTVLGRTGQVGNLPGGTRVNLVQWAEERARSHPNVSDAAARLQSDVVSGLLSLSLAITLNGAREAGEDLATGLARSLAQGGPPNLRVGGVVMEALPTAPASGKLQRSALPEPDVFFTREEPRTLPPALAIPSEGQILGIFREILGLPSLEPIHDFFRTGGDSLSAAEVCALLDLPSLETLARFPTARKLAAYLSNTNVDAASESTSPVAKRPRLGPIPESKVLPDGNFEPWSNPATSRCLVVTRGSKYVLVDPSGHASSAASELDLDGSTVAPLEPNLKAHFRCKLLDCVDGSPTLVLPLSSSTAIGHSSSGHVFVGSHGGSVVCLEAESGGVVWRTELPGRLEAAVTLNPSLSCVVAASHEGQAFVLRARDGALLETLQLGAGVRADLVMELGQGGAVFIADQGGCVHRIALTTTEGGGRGYAVATSKYVGDEPLSAAPAMSSLPGRSFIATTRGSVFCLDPFPALVWKTRASPKPFFSPPLLISDSVLVACDVEGEVVGLHISSGEVLWRLSLPNMGLVSQPLVRIGPGVLLVPGSKGLQALQVAHGTSTPRALDRVNVTGVTSALCALSGGPRLIHQREGGWAVTHGSDALLVFTTGSSLVTLECRESRFSEKKEVGGVSSPNGCFSGPVGVSFSRLFVGNRDDEIVGLGFG